MVKAVSIKATGKQLIDGLLGGTKWNGSITYSSPDSEGDYQPGYFKNVDSTGFSALNARQIDALHFALDARGPEAGFSVEGFTKLTITFKSGGSGKGTIRGVNIDNPPEEPGKPTPPASTVLPDNSIFGGDMFLGNKVAGLTTPKAGNVGWFTMLHEAGHALGLDHGHETEPGGFGTLPSNRDSIEFSVMTYRTFIGDSKSGLKATGWNYPQTYMMLDIAALQHMYGPDFTTNRGDTTYKWNPKSGDTLVNGKVAIQPGGNKIFATIWDGGGTDTYDLTAYTRAVTIDLRPGEHSVFSSAQLANLGGGPNGGKARGNIFNALQHKDDPRSLIENAKGGSGHDTIIGNDANNKLWGNNGPDGLYGGAGYDHLYGGAGYDHLSGGAGIDKLYGGAGHDHLYGGAGHDHLYGGAGNDGLYGGAGNDRLYSDGDDRLYGGSDSDYLYAGNSNDMLYGGSGNDFLYGNSNDKLYGGENNDILYGAGNDKLYGGAGNDRLYSNRSANNNLYGGDGDDHLYGSLRSSIYGDWKFDRFYGGAGHDIAYISRPLLWYTVDVYSYGIVIYEWSATHGDSKYTLYGVEAVVFV